MSSVSRSRFKWLGNSKWRGVDRLTWQLTLTRTMRCIVRPLPQAGEVTACLTSPACGRGRQTQSGCRVRGTVLNVVSKMTSRSLVMNSYRHGRAWFVATACERHPSRSNFGTRTRAEWVGGSGPPMTPKSSSLHFPRRAIRTVLQSDPLGEKFVADAIGFLEVLVRPSSVARGNGVGDGHSIDRLLRFDADLGV